MASNTVTIRGRTDARPLLAAGRRLPYGTAPAGTVARSRYPERGRSRLPQAPTIDVVLATFSA
ncbi:hypothetical protein FAGKG844_170006 [Frankia sp. AgKG'84/4]